MIFAQYWSPWDVFMLLSIVLFVPMCVGVLVGSVVLRGACSLVNIIFPEPEGTDGVPVPRFGKAVKTLAVVVACTCLVMYPTLRRFGLSLFLWVACLLWFVAMSAFAARMLGAPLWRAAFVLVVTIAVTCVLVVPIWLALFLQR